MVVCVARAAEKAGFGAPVIAAADEEIIKTAEAHGVRAVLTEADLPSGSDRVRAAADSIDPDRQVEIVVNVQGDMPELAPEHVMAVVSALRADPDADIATLVFASTSQSERMDDDVVKVILAESHAGEPVKAQCFTREGAQTGVGPFWHHIGIYAFRRDALDRFCNLPPSAREKRDRLEQWRALDDGMKIICAGVKADCPGIDSPNDLVRIRARWGKGNKK